MAASDDLLTGGPGLSQCLLLVAHFSAELSKPDRPLKTKEQTEGKSNQAVEMINFTPCAPFAVSQLSLTSLKIRENFPLSFV